MIESNKYIRLTSAGTSQEGRAFPALDFDYVKIDERSFEDLMVFASGFSKLINFYNLKNKVEGDWSEFLTDETVILATIIDSDPSGIEINFKDNLHKAKLFKRPEKKIFYLRKSFKDIYDIALRFQVWLTRLKAVESFTGQELAIKNEISNAISSKLSSSLKALHEFYTQLNKHLPEDDQLTLAFSRFEKIWGVETLSLGEVNPEQEVSFQEFINKIPEQLQQSFQAFYETLLYLKMKAPEYLQASLKTDTHYPEVSLFLAFLKLFKHAQGNINNLSKRHLDFYYSTVLRQKAKEAVRDKVYLKFKPYDTAVFAQIKEGSAFLAGEDQEGNEIVYKADYNLQINKAQIERLRTIFISRNTFNVKGTEKSLFKEILSSDISIADLTRKPEDNMPRRSYSTFGESQDGKGSYEKTMSDATIGFAIASPVLFLNEGYREIELTLQFSSEKYKGFMEKLEDLAYLEKNPENEIFIKAFLEAFTLEITCPEGWYAVKKYVISRNNEMAALVIRFDLDESEPAVVKFNTEVHEGIYQTKSPLIKIKLNNESHIYPYSLLKDLVLEEVDIKTNVSGLKDILLYNNLGQLSPDSPFYPFGSMPNVGSYLLIGNNEIFRKSLDKLNVNIEWFDLPRGKSGFYGHYQDYGINIDNTSFEGKISVLDNGRWKPALPEQQTVKLFRSQGSPDTDVINPKSEIDEQTFIQNIDIGKIKQAPDYAGIEQKLLYSNTSQRGFVKIQLSNPDPAFGHTAYQG